jgi:hypothetical protein
MKHFWRCSSVPPEVLKAWRSPERSRRRAQQHAHSCEYMGGGRRGRDSRDSGDSGDNADRWD